MYEKGISFMDLSVSFVLKLAKDIHRVISRIVRAGCHSVVMAQVVERWQQETKAEVQSQVAASFTQVV